MSDSTLKPGTAEIRWTCEVRCGPNSPLVEVAVFADRITLSDLPADSTNGSVRWMAVGMLCQQFRERFLEAMDKTKE